ncbi:MAG: response regulator transcription factor [Bacteroidales bacterium]|nr:response regulator transcription factor [Bacteroidales bacterium]
MRKYRSIIVDDESGARNLIRGFFARFFPDYEILGEASSVDEAVKLIDEVKPDLLLLDIEMPLGTGFDVVKQCSFQDFSVIFITAHDHYALDAFRISAVDYLLKPLRVQDLREALERFEKRAVDENKGGMLKILMDNLNTDSAAAKRIVLPSIHGFELVPIHTIVRCEAERNYTAFYLDGDKKNIASRTLKEFDEMLTPLGFFRVHQSHLVNLNKVIRYYKGQGGELEMSDGFRVPVSRTKKEDLLKIFLV